MKKNILEICLSPDLGGLELCVVDYFSYFKQQTKSFLCVAPSQKLDNYINDVDKFRLKRNKFFPFLPALKLAKFIDTKKIDIIHFHWTRDIATVVLAKKIAKHKVTVIQSRHMNMTRFKNDFYHKWLYRNIDVIHAVTSEVKLQLEKFIPQSIRPKIKMVYLGVKKQMLEQSKLEALRNKYTLSGNFVVGIIGRIEEGKGQYLLVEALSKLKNFDIKVLIIGSSMDDEYLKSLKENIQALGVENSIIFTGFTKEINEHITLCDVTVLATPKETFGLVVVESMVNGVPVIATANGGPLEIIDDDVDGLLFDGTSDDLVQKIDLLYKNKALRKSLSEQGIKKVQKKFNKMRQMEKMYGVINES